MSPRHSAKALALGAWVLVLAGCSGASPGDSHAGRHDADIRLVPDPPTATTQLAVVMDVPGADPARCRFRWTRNGDTIALAGSSVLDPNWFRKGDLVAVEVEVPAAEGFRARTLKTETRVANSPPVVRSVEVSADPASGGTELAATAEVWDPDGGLTTLAWRWYRNGHPMEQATASTLSATAFASGDRIEAEALASDGESVSEPRRSEAFTLENRAPRFAAEPPAMSSEGGVLTVRVSASDPDGDPLRYELGQAPSGMTIDDHGAIRWPLPAAEHRPAELHVIVRALDARGGQATQEFTIKLGAGVLAGQQ